LLLHVIPPIVPPVTFRIAFPLTVMPIFYSCGSF
jgi:hypothetical protein